MARVENAAADSGEGAAGHTPGVAGFSERPFPQVRPSWFVGHERGLEPQAQRLLGLKGGFRPQHLPRGTRRHGRVRGGDIRADLAVLMRGARRAVVRLPGAEEAPPSCPQTDLPQARGRGAAPPSAGLRAHRGRGGAPCRAWSRQTGRQSPCGDSLPFPWAARCCLQPVTAALSVWFWCRYLRRARSSCPWTARSSARAPPLGSSRSGPAVWPCPLLPLPGDFTGGEAPVRAHGGAHCDGGVSAATLRRPPAGCTCCPAPADRSGPRGKGSLIGCFRDPASVFRLGREGVPGCMLFRLSAPRPRRRLQFVLGTLSPLGPARSHSQKQVLLQGAARWRPAVRSRGAEPLWRLCPSPVPLPAPLGSGKRGLEAPHPRRPSGGPLAVTRAPQASPALAWKPWVSGLGGRGTETQVGGSRIPAPAGSPHPCF